MGFLTELMVGIVAIILIISALIVAAGTFVFIVDIIWRVFNASRNKWCIWIRKR
jgi:hypothetical protein